MAFGYRGGDGVIGVRFQVIAENRTPKTENRDKERR